VKNNSWLKAGKLPSPVLERLLKKYTSGPMGRGVVVGPGIGIDAAVIDFTGGYLLAKTDPVTLVADDAAFYAIHVNANDIAVMGGVPRWFLATILLPEDKTTGADVELIFRDLKKACDSLCVCLCGGHTEISPSVNSPVIVGQMLGEVAVDGLITTAGARNGDSLILTEAIAIEGTSIIAKTLGPGLIQSNKFTKTFITRCANLLRRPGISVLKAARIASATGKVHAMHDPTEGGLSAAIHEMAIASGHGVIVENEAIPILPATEKLCRHYGIEAMGLIASGSLLISAAPEGAEDIIKTLTRAGIPAAAIGRIVDKTSGVQIRSHGVSRPLPLPGRDEITKIL